MKGVNKKYTTIGTSTIVHTSKEKNVTEISIIEMTQEHDICDIGFSVISAIM